MLGGTLTELSANADLNSLTTPGNYMAGFAVAPSVTNKPSDIANAFVVYVEMGYQVGKATQRLIDWNGTVYSRFQHSGGWYDWRRLDNFGCSTPEALASLLGGPAYGNSVITLANNITNSGTVDFLVGDSVNNRQDRNPIQLYSIWIWGTNVERMLLVAIVNRYTWEKDVKELWNTVAGLGNNCTLSIATKGSGSDGFTISYSITNGSSCKLLAKKLNY